MLIHIHLFHYLSIQPNEEAADNELLLYMALLNYFISPLQNNHLTLLPLLWKALNQFKFCSSPSFTAINTVLSSNKIVLESISYNLCKFLLQRYQFGMAVKHLSSMYKWNEGNEN